MDKLSFKVESSLLYGRSGPARSKWNLPYMKARGLKAIISLVQNQDSQEIMEAGIIHYSLPFEDKLRIPYASSNNFLFPILMKFDDIVDCHLANGEPVLVHCNAGNDRTGLLLGYYILTRNGVKAKKAIKKLRKQNPNALTANGFEDGFCALADTLVELYQNRLNK